MAASNIKYSIIIPHKNSSGLLLKLLSTIPDDDSYQVIIVDDNSNQEHVAALKEHKFCNNVEIHFNPQGGGAGKARNIALSKAKGKWLLFSDADDYFTPSLNEQLEKYYNSDKDIIYFGCTSKYIDTGETAYRHERLMVLVDGYLANPCPESEDMLKYHHTGPVCKLIRKEIVDTYKLKFDEVIASNDVFFAVNAAYRAKSIDATSEPIYVITVSKGSLMNTFSKEVFTARFEVALRVNDFLCSIKKNKHQLSVLYYIAKSRVFGFKYVLYVLKRIIQHRSNLTIGFSKIFQIKKVLETRENKKYVLKK